MRQPAGGQLPERSGTPWAAARRLMSAKLNRRINARTIDVLLIRDRFQVPVNALVAGARPATSVNYLVSIRHAHINFRPCTPYLTSTLSTSAFPSRTLTLPPRCTRLPGFSKIR